MKNFIERLKRVDKGTIIRSATLVVTVLNVIAMGIAELCGSHSVPYMVISIIAVVISALIAGWKDNNWSDFAILMGKIWKAREDGTITDDEVADILDKKESNKQPQSGGSNRTNMVK